MDFPASEPALRQAAVLTQHWSRRDVGAVVLMLAGMNDKDLEDLVISLLMMRDKSMDEIRGIITGVSA